MHLTLSPTQAAIHDRQDEAEIHAMMNEVLARAGRLSARAGYVSVYFDYEPVEILHPDGTLLAKVEADPWAPEQRELARRILQAADPDDVLSKEDAARIVHAEYGATRPDWCRTQYGTALAERTGCWQAYASLRAPLHGEGEED